MRPSYSCISGDDFIQSCRIMAAHLPRPVPFFLLRAALVNSRIKKNETLKDTTPSLTMYRNDINDMLQNHCWMRLSLYDKNHKRAKIYCRAVCVCVSVIISCCHGRVFFQQQTKSFNYSRLMGKLLSMDGRKRIHNSVLLRHTLMHPIHRAVFYYILYLPQLTCVAGKCCIFKYAGLEIVLPLKKEKTRKEIDGCIHSLIKVVIPYFLSYTFFFFFERFSNNVVS